MQRNQTTKKLCFLQIEMFTFKMVSTKTKCITVEAKLKDSGGPVTWASFTCKLRFLWWYWYVSSVGERGSRNTVLLTDDEEGLEQMTTMITRHCRTQSFVSVVASNLKPTINVLYPACQTGVLIKEFILGKHGRIRAVLKMESGLVVLKC